MSGSRHGARPARAAVLAAIWLVSALAPSSRPLAAQALRPWQQEYLRGLELEGRGQYDAALKAFGLARTLQPRPRRRVAFGANRRLDYDPYYHMAFCLSRTGGPPSIIKKLAQRSARARVTPFEKLEALRSYVIEHSLAGRGLFRPRASPPPRRRLPAPVPPAVPMAAPTATPRPQPSPTPLPARLDLRGLPPGIVVTVDGRDHGTVRRRLKIEPGRHHVLLLDHGQPVYDQRLRLAPGEMLVVMVPTPPPAMPTPPPTPTAARPAAPAPAPASRSASGRPLPALLGAGFLLFVAAAGLLWWRYSRRRRPELMEITPTRRLATPPGGLTGHAFGPYLIVEKIGSGGMATTYRARRRSDGKEVALKIPHDHCLEDESFRRRFLREGRLGAQLHHPNMVRIIEAGEDGGTPYIAMELVHGVTLREILNTAGQLPLERALDLARQTGEALDYAHSKGVIHRDLKPENLMVLPDGHLLVMDFGIARIEGGDGLTSTSIFMGTPAYAAPEAVAKEPVDHRMDLYALGMILYEMLEGEPPFAGSSPLEQLQLHLAGKFPKRSEIPRPLPDPLWELLLRLVARRPDDRFPTAEAFLVALNEIVRAHEEGTLA